MGKIAYLATILQVLYRQNIVPMLNEAILTLEEGVAEPEAIDGIMKLGMNHPIGTCAFRFDWIRYCSAHNECAT